MPEYDVFLSHANADKPMVNLIYKDLLDQEFEVWYDKDNIHGGNRWTQAIQDGIDNSKVLVVVWTENSSKSDWVDKEITRALSKNIPVIPLLMDDVELTISLGNIQYIDARLGYVSAFRELISRIQKYVQNENSEKHSRNFAWIHQKRPSLRSEFLKQNNYFDDHNENFALNTWTNKLHRFKGNDWVKANSFVSFCAVPIPDILEINLKEIQQILRDYNNLEFEQSWRQLNLIYFTEPKQANREYVLHENRRGIIDIKPYTYFRFHVDGNFEFSDCYHTTADFENTEGQLCQKFNLISILGATLKLIHFLAYFYRRHEYLGQFQFLINLHNTEESILGNFASEGRSGWESNTGLNRWVYRHKGISSDNHLQFVYNINVENIHSNSRLVEEIMADLSENIQWAFNLDDKPRYSMPQSDVFHWDSYYDGFI